MNAEQILLDVLYRAGIPNGLELVHQFKTRVQAECEQLDGKACGYVWKRKDGTVEEGFFILVPRDKWSLRTIQHYLQLCADDPEVGEAQVEGAMRVLKRFERWQDANEDKVKTPDIKEGDNNL